MTFIDILYRLSLKATCKNRKCDLSDIGVICECAYLSILSSWASFIHPSGRHVNSKISIFFEFSSIITKSRIIFVTNTWGGIVETLLCESMLLSSFQIHTMPGGTSTSRLSPKLRTITRHVYSHSGVPNCRSWKLSKANFCTIANI